MSEWWTRINLLLLQLSHHLLAVNLTFLPPPPGFEVAREAGAPLTGAGSAESRSLCLWRTALARGLIGRPRYTAHSVHTQAQRQQTQTLARSVPVAQLEQDWPDLEVKSAGRCQTALKSPGSGQDFGVLKKSAWLRFRTTPGHVA